MTYGLGVYAVAGFRAHYPASTTNPIFTPQSNTPGAPGGFGSLYTQATFFQVAPTATYAINENFAIGGGPTLTLAELVIDPLLLLHQMTLMVVCSLAIQRVGELATTGVVVLNWVSTTSMIVIGTLVPPLRRRNGWKTFVFIRRMKLANLELVARSSTCP